MWAGSAPMSPELRYWDRFCVTAGTRSWSPTRLQSASRSEATSTRPSRRRSKSSWAQIDRLALAGAEIAQIPVLGDIAEVNARHRRLIAAEFVKEHRERFRNYGTQYQAKSAALFAEGSALSRRAITAGRASSRRLTRSLVAVMDAHGLDVWAAPSATDPPRGASTTSVTRPCRSLGPMLICQPSRFRSAR